ncbi:CVNH domain-containing protein [Colletotrichum graminicola]|nr:CVNH domain-containing protein [Colletotrichum graminicola]
MPRGDVLNDKQSSRYINHSPSAGYSTFLHHPSSSPARSSHLSRHPLSLRSQPSTASSHRPSSSRTATMRFLSITAVLSAVAVAVSARDCPLESDCVQKSCKNFQLHFLDPDALRSIREWKLTADCKDNAGNKMVTQLYLEECLANTDGNLIWSPGLSLPPKHCLTMAVRRWIFLPLSLSLSLSRWQIIDIHNYIKNSGGFRCFGCKLTNTNPLTMECGCMNKKDKIQTRVVNLSEGIWVYDGAIGCYQTGTGTALKGIVGYNYNAGLLKSPGIGKY